MPEIGDSEFRLLQRFYASRAYLPLWTDSAGLRPAGEILLARLALLRDAGQLTVAPLVAAARARDAIGSRAAELDLLLSAALARGAIDPQDPASFAERTEVLADAAATRNLPDLLGSLLPADAAFWRLRAATQAYRAIAARGGWPIVPAGPKLALGAMDARVALLRQRLLVTGDLPAIDGVTSIFDSVLDGAVRRFQSRHGLQVDGVVGKNTFAALNAPVGQRLATMQINLMRMQTQRRDWGQRYIVVNTAAASYRLVDGGRQVFERVAIVGRRDWPTPQIDSAIDRVEFNPYWVVPPRIARLEVLPKIRRDPDYLRKHDMHFINGQIRQDPGPKNPLGAVKFLFPNPYDVYMHDTNSPGLFERQDRHLSHGCMRVPNARDLAAYLFKDDPSWPRPRIEAVIQAGVTLQVRLASPVPLHVVYETAWVDVGGTVQFRDDVYGRDRVGTAAIADAGACPCLPCEG